MSKRSSSLREKRIARDAARQAVQRGDNVSAQRVAASKVASIALQSFNNKGFFDRHFGIVVGSLTDTSTLCVCLTDIASGSGQGTRLGRTLSLNTIQLDGVLGIGGSVPNPTFYDNTLADGSNGILGSPDTLVRMAAISCALVMCSVVPRDATRAVNNRQCLRWDEVFEPPAAGDLPYRTLVRDHAGNSTNFKVLKTWSYLSYLNLGDHTFPKRMKFYKRFREPIRVGYTGTTADVLTGSTNQLFLMAVSNYVGSLAATTDTTKPFVQFTSSVSYDP